MKKRIILLLSIFSLAFVIPVKGQFGKLIDNVAGGPSPNRLMKEGKFLDALVVHLKKVEEKPNKKRILKSLGKDYPELMDSIQAQQTQLTAATQHFQGDQTVKQTNELISHLRSFQNAHEIFDRIGISRIEIKKLTVDLDIPDVQDKVDAANSLLVQHSEAAAEMHYQQGLFHSTYGDIERQKAAAREFRRALYFIPDYRDSQEKYEIARDSGTKHIIILPYKNLSNTIEFGAVGDYFSGHLISILARDDQVMEFLKITSESELQAVLQGQGQMYTDNISNATGSELMNMINADALYFGKVNQILNPKPTTFTSDVKSHTARVKVGTTKSYNEKKNREETKDVYDERSATYRDYTKTFSTTVSGTHAIMTGESPQLSPFKKNLTWSQSWNRKVAGNEKVYEKIKKKASSIPSPGKRVNYVIEQIAQELYLEIKNEVLGAEYPTITRIDQMDTP